MPKAKCPDALEGEEAWALSELRGLVDEPAVADEDSAEGARVVGEDSGNGGSARGHGEVLVV